MPRGKHSPSRRSSSFIKGKLVEHIVATLYGDENVQVEKNVRFPVTDNSARKREIDILVTHLIESPNKYSIIECKNYDKVIGSPLIDAFVGKLDDIGIPAQSGIYISVKGFTQGAIERATKAGIKTLVITGLTKDRLSVETTDALQFIIFLAPTVKSIVVHCENQSSKDPRATPFLYTYSGKIRGSIFDFFWKEWIQGNIESSIGEHKVKLELSNDYYLPTGEKFDTLEKVAYIDCTAQITGLVFSVTGVSKQHLLINQTSKQLERFLKDATFNRPTGTHKIFSFETEHMLQEFLYSQKAAIKIAPGRNKLPRIKAYSIYWPISQRAFGELLEAYNSYQRGEIPEFDIEKLTYIEGTDLKTVWEPIWDENPILNEVLINK